MSDMYRKEVPAYSELVELVERTNGEVLRVKGDRRCDNSEYISSISQQCHGAIRVGKPEELRGLRRLFALYGMYPVNFYDLVPAGIPVFSTAFRALTESELNQSPFRIFCSLLRVELIEDSVLRRKAGDILANRSIFTPKLEQLINAAEAAGGVSDADADDLISLSVSVFQWHQKALVDAATYDHLLNSHRLVADIVSFKGPHINHLTPRALDIDAVQRAMPSAGLNAKLVIEGPPARRCPILLRQTAFNALEERVTFEDQSYSVVERLHRARFGEVEQRGVALTPAGRTLYDVCLSQAKADCPLTTESDDAARYQVALERAFAKFPDDWQTLLERKLVYFRFTLSKGTKPTELTHYRAASGLDLARAVRDGLLEAEPIVYQDFLPISAAGIFQSNLGDENGEAHEAHSSQRAFEAALGEPVRLSDTIYAQLQAESVAELERLLELPSDVA